MKITPGFARSSRRSVIVAPVLLFVAAAFAQDPAGVPNFHKVNDPHGMGSTLINGVNDRGELVGFYTDSAGNTDGFLAKP